MLIGVVTGITVAILFGPIVLIVWVSFTPTRGLSMAFRQPSLRWYAELFQSREFIESFGQSVYIAGWTTVLSIGLGTLAAYAIARFRFPGRDLVNTVLLSPLMIPHVAIGIGLVQFLSRIGVPRGYFALVMSHVVVTLPYVVRTVGASLLGVDRNLELAARDLGASWLRAVWSVTLPLVRPGLLAGGVFTFVTSFDEVTVSLFLAGARVVPLPVRLFTYIETVIEPVVAAVSALLVLLSLGAILLLERLAGLERILGGFGERGGSARARVDDAPAQEGWAR
jgi:putative spermidine/putrescine transport system permease protein